MIYFILCNKRIRNPIPGQRPRILIKEKKIAKRTEEQKELDNQFIVAAADIRSPLECTLRYIASHKPYKTRLWAFGVRYLNV